MTGARKKDKPEQATGDVTVKQTGPHPLGLLDYLLMAIAGIIAAVLFFTNLDDKYLWQDEAATAVLGERMMKYGKPLAYDGKNLITMDNFFEDNIQTVDQHTGDARTALDYFINRGDFKSDTTWIGQPWWQFVVAGISLLIFGHNTLAARAPFAAAGLITVLLLYWFIRVRFQDKLMAMVAVGLALTNTCWVLHGRQCRYYALTSLLFLLTLMAFDYWQRKKRLGGLFFVMTAWFWFQTDYGTFWPVIGILLAIAVWQAWPRVIGTVSVAAALGALVAPWVWYYELFGRVKATAGPWSVKLVGNLFHLNQFIIPLPILVAAGIVLIFRWHKTPTICRQLLLASLLIPLVLVVWVTTAAPWCFHRYLVHLTPIAALLIAWLFVEAGKWFLHGPPTDIRPVLVTVTLAVIIALCPLPSNLVAWVIPKNMSMMQPLGTVIRPELTLLGKEVFGHRIDPNRAVIELLRDYARPEDEILVTYEDIPFMFYLENPIRGGIPCFRVEDRIAPPRFLVARRSFPLLHWSIFQREVNRYRWKPIPVHAPDIQFGNNPDPDYLLAGTTLNPPDIFVAQRVDDAL